MIVSETEGFDIAPTRRFGVGTTRARAGLRDLARALASWRVWTALGWLDVKQRYRRAMIGPLWITISMCVMVGALGVIYAGLFHQEIHSFLPFLAGGFIVWFLLSTTITECAIAFVQGESLIKHGGLPVSLHVLRVVHRNLIVGAHNLLVLVAIYAWQPDLLGWAIFLFVPGLILVVVNLAWIGLIVATLCTRFRDLPPIIQNLLQVLFFGSPVMYRPASIPEHLSFLVNYNPIHYFIDALRLPILGVLPEPKLYLILAGMAALGWLITFRLFMVARARIAYWL